MSPSRLEISSHAKKRIKVREITRIEIRRCLFEGKLTGIDLKGRKIHELKVKKRILVVIFIDIKGGQLVVTSYWKGEWS